MFSLSSFLNKHRILDISGYYFDNLGDLLTKRKRESCCYSDILLVYFQEGKVLPTFHQVSQICCAPSFTMTNLSGKLYLISYFLGIWQTWGCISDMVGWCQCSGFRSRHGAMHRWLGRWFSLKHRKSLNICIVVQLQECCWSLQIFTPTSEMHWWQFEL